MATDRVQCGNVSGETSPCQQADGEKRVNAYPLLLPTEFQKHIAEVIQLVSKST